MYEDALDLAEIQRSALIRIVRRAGNERDARICLLIAEYSRGHRTLEEVREFLTSQDES